MMNLKNFTEAFSGAFADLKLGLVNDPVQHGLIDKFRPRTCSHTPQESVRFSGKCFCEIF